MLAFQVYKLLAELVCVQLFPLVVQVKFAKFMCGSYGQNRQCDCSTDHAEVVSSGVDLSEQGNTGRRKKAGGRQKVSEMHGGLGSFLEECPGLVVSLELRLRWAWLRVRFGSAAVDCA